MNTKSAQTHTTKACLYHLHKEVSLALPFFRYCEVFNASNYVFLLDSAKNSGNLGEYSYLGADPYLIFNAKRNGNSLAHGAQIIQTTFKSEAGTSFAEPQLSNYTQDPFVRLQELVAQYSPNKVIIKDSPFALNGGAVGYFGYEAGYFIEDLPDQGADDLSLPDIYLGFYDLILCYNHKKQKAYASIIGRGTHPEMAIQNANAVFANINKRLHQFDASFNSTQQEAYNLKGTDLPKLNVNGASKETYCEHIKTCLEHIKQGNVYEVCLTHRLEAAYCGSGWELYKQLRIVNPAPFSSYLRFPEAEVISSSPERFLKLDNNKVIESRPIKGTRPRGNTPEKDNAYQQDLQQAVKDRAENIMIVDLVRNDLGKVSTIGSVSVPDLFVVEQYATVWQLVSTVRGQLKPELDGFDLLRATFPGGSMTGAPKIEAMKIIDSLEPVKRGVYSGAIGYIDYSGVLDLNIVIRTIILKDKTCYFNVGGAIVANSDPLDEYIETMDKAVALKQAIARAIHLKL